MPGITDRDRSELYEELSDAYNNERLRIGKRQAGLPTTVLGLMLLKLMVMASKRSANWSAALFWAASEFRKYEEKK